MQKSSSFFLQFASPTLKSSQLVLYFISSVTQILRSSRGRYKIFGVIQYLAALYKDCMLDYLKSYRIKEWPRNLKNSKTIQDSMKTGRKVFRLLRWIEEIGNIDKNLQKTTDIISLLKFLRNLISTIYYISDNIVWVIEAGVINKYVFDPTWKWESLKNAMSLLRYFLLMFITLLKTKKFWAKEKNNHDDMLRKNLVIREGNNGYNLMLVFYKIRYKRRYSNLSLLKNILRILMLYKALRLPGSEKFSMIFHNICGIFSYALAIAKLLALQNSLSVKKPRRLTVTPSYSSRLAP